MVGVGEALKLSIEWGLGDVLKRLALLEQVLSLSHIYR